MKYIVTGGAGFIGSNLVDELINKGHEVRIIDNLSTGKRENINPKAKFYNIDICDFERIKPIFKDVDYVFHLAALARVALSVKNPIETSRVNVLGSISIFKVAADAKVKRVVFYSSSAVYGDYKKMPFNESTPLNCVSPYGLQKLAAEQFAKLFLEIYHIDIVCLRFFNVYGPRIDFDSDYGLVIGKFLDAAIHKKPLTIFGNGKQTRGFCYVNDAVEASILAMTSSKVKPGQIINISDDTSYSINYIAKIIGGQIIYLPKRQGDPMHTSTSIALAKKLLKWQPRMSLQEGIEKTKRWLIMSQNN